MRSAIALTLLLFATAGHGAGDVDSPRWSREYDRTFEKYSKRYFGPFFDWRWFKAQAIAESQLHPEVKSDKGAVGLMQILPATYEEIRQSNPHFLDITTPRWNIAAGIYYDRKLYRKWSLPSEQDRLYLALASYNAGYQRMVRVSRKVEEPLQRWEQIREKAPGETRHYVKRIRNLMAAGRTPASQRQHGIERLLSLFGKEEKDAP